MAITTLAVAFLVIGTVFSQQAPRYKLNLDLPPAKRWDSILKHWNASELKADLNSVMSSLVPEALIPVVELVGENVEKYIPSPYGEEMVGVAQCLDMNVGDVVMLNLLYDMSAFCTSIVAQDTHGQIWHGRNLDYRFTDILRKLTFVYDAQQNGKTVFTATTFAGYIGVLTGMRPKSFSISADERDQGKIWQNLLEMINALLTGEAYFVSFLVRETLTKTDNFEDAVKMLSTPQIIAPVYFIIGGVSPGEGAVVTRDRLQARDVWRLDVKNGRWFLVETNYDHWVPPPKDDDRRDPANKAMNSIGQAAINATMMYDKVLSVKPVLQSDSVYTTLMSAADPDIYKTVIRSNV
ncbi:N-acylethanolamine-hydrolyzing acid amidase-like [Ptychodera flava]|uniref:N-acylethanolamine-hydrolyzing acid amidase-like n=1 Tax=Ptychodera flava TaxID=63121 RepID=UPI00396AAADE